MVYFIMHCLFHDYTFYYCYGKKINLTNQIQSRNGLPDQLKDKQTDRQTDVGN